MHGDWNRRRRKATTNSAKKKARILWTCYAIRRTGKKNDAFARKCSMIKKSGKVNLTRPASVTRPIKGFKFFLQHFSRDNVHVLHSTGAKSLMKRTAVQI